MELLQEMIDCHARLKHLRLIADVNLARIENAETAIAQFREIAEKCTVRRVTLDERIARETAKLTTLRLEVFGE